MPAKRVRWFILALLTLLLLLIGNWGWQAASTNRCPARQIRVDETCIDLSLRISSGDRSILTESPNAEATQGMEQFRAGQYSSAGDLFQQAYNRDRQNPEWLIYLNNARARQSDRPLIIAVAVPADARPEASDEILRGVAQAQHQFNEAKGLGGRLLEVRMVNDSNNPAIAALLARELSRDRAIIGVVGHNSSDASQAALKVYSEVNLAMVSPTSTSTALAGPNFFRTVPSDKATGQRLADHANRERLLRAVLFFDATSSYSQSLTREFSNRFNLLGGRVLRTVDLNLPNFNAAVAVRQSVETDRATVLLLLPSTKLTAKALDVAKALHEMRLNERLPLLGGDALYGSATLEIGAAIDGMVVTVPWLPNTPYAKTAAEFWTLQVSWRTAGAYDATQALITAIRSRPLRPNRVSILQGLETLELPAEKTSGTPLAFEQGDRSGQAFLVQADRGDRSGWEFSPIN